MSNLQIDNENKQVRLIVDTKFYGANAVVMAAKEYTESCWVYVDGALDDKILVTIKPKSKDIDYKIVGYEFYNYVLGLIQDACWKKEF